MVFAPIARVQGPQPRKGADPGRPPPGRRSPRHRHVRVAAPRCRPGYGNPAGSVAVERATRPEADEGWEHDQPARVRCGSVELTTRSGSADRRRGGKTADQL